MKTLEYLKNKYNLSFDALMPIVLYGFGRRVELGQLFKNLDFNVGVEIGTDTGRWAKDICEQVPQLKLYCIDPWVAYTEGNEFKDQVRIDEIYQEVKERLKYFNCEIIRKTSIEAVNDFEPNSLDFVFIDGNHEFEYVLEDITAWTKIVRVGGIIVGHDYREDKNRNYGVVEAVQKYITENQINPWFVLHKGGNLVDCWMFIKS